MIRPPIFQQISSSLLLLLAAVLIAPSQAEQAEQTVFRELDQYPAGHAHQAVAVDEVSFYAIANRSIARHDKATGEQLAEWTAAGDSPIRHLNSGIVLDGKLYCAHSNWPQQPLKNTIEVFDAQSLKHVEAREFPHTDGAINWVDRRQGNWWVVFAFYGDEKSVARTRLVRYDDQWREQARYTFPESVVERFLPNSNSGGAWGPDGLLYATGHDRGELYALQVSESAGELKHVATVPAAIAGQGIAWDRSDVGTLYGIVRSRKQVVKMRLSHAVEYGRLQRPVTWQRHPKNPILPPRPSGNFDSTRCMNPWVVRDGAEYQLYYSGGDDRGTQRIGMATAAVDNVAQWTRSEPLFETGRPGAFDARWCVLPHVVEFAPGRRHLYYTGNAGRGSGLSAFPGIGLATSTGGAWRRLREEPVIAPSGQPGDPDAIGIAGGSVVRVKPGDGKAQWRFYYTGCPTIGKPLPLNQQKTICLAVSDDGVDWQKQGAVMLRDPNRDYEDIGVAGPVVQQLSDGTFRMWYSAIGTRWGYYSICYAESPDGIHWRRGEKYGENLQLEPTGNGWESQMVEYPSIVREGNRLRMFYCGNGYGKTGIGTAISSPIDE